jgi:hypothetical protein
MLKHLFETQKHRKERLQNNERCRRYYQRHLSSQARRTASKRFEKKVREDSKEAPKEAQKEPQYYFAEGPTSFL